MKCQSLFLGKIRKTFQNACAEIFTQHALFFSRKYALAFHANYNLHEMSTSIFLEK